MKLSRANGVKALLIAVGMVSISATAAPISLGEAGNYNAYILENMTGNMSDVEGRLAVGGDLTLDNYAIGLELPADNNKLVTAVGGDATLRNMRIYNGDAEVAGNIDINDTVGLYNGEDTANGKTIFNQSTVDFSAISSDITYRSALWGSYAATAATQVNKNDLNEIWDITFSGSDELNFFSLDAADLSSPNKRITFDIPTTSYAVINVYGESVELFNTGFYSSILGGKIIDNKPGEFRHDGTYTNNILFNFVDATELTLHAIGFKGSILAPLADTIFYDGHIDGNLIVKSLTSPEGTYTGQVNNYRFAAEVSEPGSLAIMLLAGLYLVYLRKSLLRQNAVAL